MNNLSAFDDRHNEGEKDLDNSLSERTILNRVLLDVIDGSCRSNGNVISTDKLIRGNGHFLINNDQISANFSGAQGSYQLIIAMPKSMDGVNGISVKYRLSGWKNIRYLAIGHSSGDRFCHVKITNPIEGKWINFSMGYNDIIYGLQNGWEQPPSPSSAGDLRLYVSGSPDKNGSSLDIRWVAHWKEDVGQIAPWRVWKTNESIKDTLIRYFRLCNPNIDKHAEEFLYTGNLPLTGASSLDWPVDQELPIGLHESGTYRYIWHAMQPAISLMVYGDSTNNLAAIISARDLISDWLLRSYYTHDEDIKYAWYDHGTAERLIAFLLMAQIGTKYGFDHRFMARLNNSIARHALLLESEAFYAAHQPVRYHNHAWFQDIALITIAMMNPGYPSARRWLSTGLSRLTDQLDHMIIREEGYAVFIENSIGYHHGIQRIINFAAELIGQARVDSTIPDMAKDLSMWSDYLRYPDGRVPSHGDTFRKPNIESKLRKSVAREFITGMKVLPKSGYAVVKGLHGDTPFMLCVIASCLINTHKHEDNLSFTLFFDGVEWLIDPSMYSHEYASPIPAYLRSARAHNNLVIPGRVYSLFEGMATLRGEQNESEYCIFGEHQCYQPDKVTRTLTGLINELVIHGEDLVETARSDDYITCLVFHCGEGVSAENLNGSVILSHPASAYKLVIKCNGKYQHLSGMNDDNIINSIAGAGFMQVNETNSIVYESPVSRKYNWKIIAI